MVKKINAREYVNQYSDQVKDYKNVEVLTVVGKQEIFHTATKRKSMKVVLENQYGTRKYISPDCLEYFYKKNDDNTFSLNPQVDGGDTFFAKCKALSVDRPMRISASNGEEKVLDTGDYILLYKNSRGDVRLTAMEFLEFTEMFAEVKKRGRRAVRNPIIEM